MWRNRSRYPLPGPTVDTSPLFWLTRVRTRSGAVRVSAHGELDLAGHHAIDTLLREVQDETATVVLDLGDLSFMDSTGLHVCTDAETRARRAATSFLVAPGPPGVQRVFTLAGLDRRFNWTTAPRHPSA